MSSRARGPWKLRGGISRQGAELSSSTFVFISSRRGEGLGRTERRLLRVMEDLVSHGARVLFIGTYGNAVMGRARAMGVECHEYKLGRWNVLRTVSRLRKYLRRYSPPVLHSSGHQADTLARLAARPLPTKVVNTVECEAWPPDAKRRRDRMRKRVDMRTLHMADVVIVDCEELAETLHAENARAQVLIFPPSVDLGRVYEQAEEPIGRELASPAVGYVGSLEASRGVEILLELAPRLAGDAQVVVSGAGPYAGELSACALQAGLLFLGEVRPGPALLAALDVAIFPSTTPGIPIPLLEAATLGRPIVASAVSGITGLFSAEEIVLVPPGDADALEAAVRGLLGDPERAARMGQAARLKTIDEYSSVAAVSRHLDLYRRLMLE